MNMGHHKGNNVPKKTKLHLGSGKINIPGYINIDILTHPSVDLVCDIRDLPFDAESVDEIYACAVLEHFGRNEWEDVLAHWISLLSKGALIRISTTDFLACAEHYIEHRNLSAIQGLIIGGQRNEWDWHGVLFDFETLRLSMERLGLKNVQRYDWRDTVLHKFGIDDYSQAYLPHMEKDTGKLMVLNIQGEK